MNTLPYKQIPGQMMVELIYFCIMWLKTVPNKIRISDNYLPGEIAVQQQLDYKKHCWTPFGAYCEVIEGQERANTMASQTWVAISLGSTSSIQGMYRFMCLTTGKIIKRRQFKELPMSESIVQRLQEWDKEG